MELVAGIVLLVVAIRGGVARFRLMSVIARWCLGAMGVVLIAAAVVSAPYSLGYCSGGLDAPAECSGVESETASLLAALTLLATLVAGYAAAALAVVALLAETVMRMLRRAGPSRP